MPQIKGLKDFVSRRFGRLSRFFLL